MRKTIWETYVQYVISIYTSIIMVPFKETISTKQELIEACKKGFKDYSNKRISKNDFCMYFGFTHGEAITTFYEGDYEKLLLDGGFNPGSIAYFSGGINAWKNLRDGKYIFPPIIQNIEPTNTVTPFPLQTIYYGTPGSGKSRKVKGIVEDVDEDFVFRTTFHPDSDYASFVGCYKPVMKNDVIKYQFTPQTFTKAYVAAWNNPEQQIYLIIEEINRGNCAQIFGDLFQLLDRENGVSEYPIDADNDLKDYLEQELGAGHEGIKNGKLKLPSNLNILATMNTSDQSLFPMDSAFKRRWAWECVPVDYTNSDSGKFTIKIGDSEYKWHDFLLKANNRIKDLTFSEDKQMGNFFISSNVDKRQFIDKVMFYLWNDICKDEYGSGSFFRRYIDNNNPESEFSFNDLFGEENKIETILNGFMKYLAVEKIEAATSTEEEQ